MLLKVVLAFALLAVPAAAAETEAEMKARVDDVEAQRAALRALLPTILADERLGEAQARCPAEHFDTRSDLAARFGQWLAGATDGLSEEVCSIAPVTCWQLCETADGDACTNLAHAFGEHEDDWGDDGAREASNRLYAFGCEAGHASGCTNRGGALRNDLYPSEPLMKLGEAGIEQCTFALFSLACKEDDAWGCTMRGQAQVRGEGTAVDFAAARTAFEKACAPGGNEEACEGAKTWAREGLPDAR